ncbi:MAG: hypothetical protein ACRETU_08830 [Steroidobacterales bacterium]
MMNANKSSRIRSAVATVAIGVVLSLVVLHAEQRNAVIVGEAVSAPITASAPASSGDFDYFPSHFTAPAGPVEDLPPQF